MTSRFAHHGAHGQACAKTIATAIFPKQGMSYDYIYGAKLK